MKARPTGRQEFDAVVEKVLPGTHDELQRRGAQWKKQREMKKRAQA